MKHYRLLMYTLLTAAAFARMMMYIAAMPPYAGLDEIYHVARLVFVAQEGRNPSLSEPSIAPYLSASIHQQPGALPSFAQIAERWPVVVRENPLIVKERPLVATELRGYTGANYEAQQPSLFYSLIARFRGANAVAELRRWRVISAVMAIVIVLATGAAGEALFGTPGILAAVTLLMLPTWMTLVLRVSNDALACALLACAFALTALHPRRLAGSIAEGCLWACALATKLYTWPALIVLPMLWRNQRVERIRIIVVASMCLTAVGLTTSDLYRRTSNPVGVFERGAGHEPLNVAEMVRVTIASIAWTSGQHWDALRPLAIALYGGPLLLLLIVYRRRFVSPFTILTITALAAFACAQAFNLAVTYRGSNAARAGKEGWYWYSLAPIVVATVIAPLIQRARLAATGALVWLFAWDVLITEGALFHDYAGATSSAHPTLLFRWGPLFAPFTADLTRVAVGPLTSAITALRIIEFISLAALIAIALRPRMRAWDSESAHD